METPDPSWLDNFNIQKIGLFSFLLIVCGLVIISLYAIISFAPWPLKSDVNYQFQQQVAINSQILDQLKQLAARDDQLDVENANENDDIIQMQQYMIDRPLTPFVPSRPRNQQRSKGGN